MSAAVVAHDVSPVAAAWLALAVGLLILAAIAFAAHRSAARNDAEWSTTYRPAPRRRRRPTRRDIKRMHEHQRALRLQRYAAQPPRHR